MLNNYKRFQEIAKKAHKYSDLYEQDINSDTIHPFDMRNIHPSISEITRSLFDSGHYSQATYEVFKYIDKRVQEKSSISRSGSALMMDAFNENKPKIKLTNLSNTSEIDEQEGYKFLFAGAIKAIRNPRGHEVNLLENMEQCLDHISFASLLLRRLDDI